MNLDLSNIKKVFFIGIGGIGISYLAKLAHARGMEVSGVNDDPSPKTLDPLRELGAIIIMKYDYHELPEADLYVYSDAWPYRGPEIIADARASGKPVMSFFEATGAFAKNYDVIAVAGTHGKTTTTAMLAEVMIEAGLDPTVCVGSFVKNLGSNFRAGNSKWFLVEADEFNRHFLNFDPVVTVITNIEADHFETYANLAEIEDAFRELVQKTKNTVVANFSSDNLSTVCEGFNGEIKNYVDYLGEVPKLQIPGEHNRMDAAAAMAAGLSIGISMDSIRGALSKFSGSWRRLEKKGATESGALVYDDYAHHPTEVKASLSGLRELYPKGEGRLVVLFQPHLYSRTKALFSEFIDAFDLADEVILLPIYFAREALDPDISSEKLVEAIRDHGVQVSFSLDFTSAKNKIKTMNLTKGDVLVTMGASDVYEIGDYFLSN